MEGYMNRSVRGVLFAVAALGAAVAPAVVSSEAAAAVPTSCSGLTAGTYDPSPQTTGVRAGSTLTKVTGDLVITAPGRYENLDVHGFVDVRAADVEIRNSRVRGGLATRSRGLINATNESVRNLVVEGVELVPQQPTLWLTGILGHDYTARCVDVYQTVDGFGVFNTHDPGGPTRVRIEQSYCHHLAYYSPDPGHADNRTHNDCVQIQGGSGAVVRFNTLHAYLSGKVGTLNYPVDHNQALSGVMLNANVGKTTDVVVSDNLINGGDIAINGGGLTYQPSDFLGTFHRNRFNRDQFHAGHTIDLDASVRADTGDGTADQNVYTDGTPVRVRRNG
jgi:hypothetical protein